MKKYVWYTFYSLLIILSLFIGYKIIKRIYNCNVVRTYKMQREGDIYIGKMDFRGRMIGEGTYIFAEGDRYEGEFSENQFSGKGTYYFASGDVYEGDFQNSDFNGFGKYTDVEGYVYEGEYKDNERHGYGRYYLRDSLILEGMWKDGEFVSTETII